MWVQKPLAFVMASSLALALSFWLAPKVPVRLDAAHAKAEEVRGAPAMPVILGQDRAASHASILSIWRSVTGFPEATVHAHWFSGTREGAKDVHIRHAVLSEGQWHVQSSELSRVGLERSTLKHIRKLGNPSVTAPMRQAGTGYAFVTSVSLGGWAGARVEQFFAPSAAPASWVHRQSLTVSPFLNISTLVRAPALPTSGGGFVLPVYHEFLVKAPEMLIFDADGRLIEKRRGLGNVGLLQPELLSSASGGWFAWFRDEDSRQGRLYRTEWDGVSLSQATPTNLPNRDTGVAVARLPDKRVLLAYNPNKRDTLAIATSKDDGLSFGAPTAIAQQAGREYSYPSLLVVGDRLWLSYTHERKGIAIQEINWRALP